MSIVGSEYCFNIKPAGRAGECERGGGKWWTACPKGCLPCGRHRLRGHLGPWCCEYTAASQGSSLPVSAQPNPSSPLAVTPDVGVDAAHLHPLGPTHVKGGRMQV